MTLIMRAARLHLAGRTRAEIAADLLLSEQMVAYLVENDGFQLALASVRSTDSASAGHQSSNMGER